MIRQIEEGDTKGGVIIPKDTFKEFVEFQKRGVKGNQGDRGFLQGDVYTNHVRIYKGYMTLALRK